MTNWQLGNLNNVNIKNKKQLLVRCGTLGGVAVDVVDVAVGGVVLGPEVEVVEEVVARVVVLERVGALGGRRREGGHQQHGRHHHHRGRSQSSIALLLHASSSTEVMCPCVVGSREEHRPQLFYAVSCG